MACKCRADEPCAHTGQGMSTRTGERFGCGVRQRVGDRGAVLREVPCSLRSECVDVDGGPTGFEVAPIPQAAARLYAKLVHGCVTGWVRCGVCTVRSPTEGGSWSRRRCRGSPGRYCARPPREPRCPSVLQKVRAAEQTTNPYGAKRCWRQAAGWASEGCVA